MKRGNWLKFLRCSRGLCEASCSRGVSTLYNWALTLDEKGTPCTVQIQTCVNSFSMVDPDLLYTVITVICHNIGNDTVILCLKTIVMIKCGRFATFRRLQQRGAALFARVRPCGLRPRAWELSVMLSW